MKTFSVRTRIYSGEDSLKVLQRFRQRKIWIICDGFLATSPLLERLKQALAEDNQLSLFSDITPDPTIATVVKGIEQMQVLRPDVVIGFGGGSALDAAKAIVWFSRQQGIEIETCIAIPTTSGTGSEVTSAFVIGDPQKNIKYPLFSDEIYPDIAILDPALVATVPPAITANTGMDVLTHALEAYVSPRASDFTDALAEKAAQLVFRHLPTACRKGDCLITRGKMHNASTLAGIAFSQAGLGINHAIAHQLGGQFHIAHGLANSLLLVPVIQFNAVDNRARKRYARLAQVCGISTPQCSEQQAVNQLIHQIEQLKKQCAMPRHLAELKIDANQFAANIPAMIAATLGDVTLKTTPRAATANDIRDVIEALL
ncbi:1-propanol dehydrogenase PduQ [Serratia aquatilis]|uniref:1-propanol dehydrogenase PduQ n=1 Tax=Serratia aquatilis TaxID=1737515 RepID=A0ABV6EHE3_9GAMM